MSLDPAFYELRTKPLPTLPERRRLIHEQLVKEVEELERFTKLAEDKCLCAAAADAARRKVRTTAAGVRLLIKALEYLGEPNYRLALYRLFGMPLPPPEEPRQLPLPLPKPKG